jgi:hypothetical protein
MYSTSVSVSLTRAATDPEIESRRIKSGAAGRDASRPGTTAGGPLPPGMEAIRAGLCGGRTTSADGTRRTSPESPERVASRPSTRATTDHPTYHNDQENHTWLVQ